MGASLFSIDVIGVMEDLQPISIINTHRGEEQVIRFTLSDGRINNKVCIFGPLNPTTEALYQDDLEFPVVLILASFYVSLFTASLCITNLPSSKIFINLDDEQVTDARERIIMANYDQLSSINASRTTWSVKVRVTRMWPSISTSAKRQSLKGYNLLLLDEDNCHVHAFVYADNWNKLSKKINIEEGGLYSVSNFYAKDAFGSLKPVSTKSIINFSNSTIVEKIIDDDFIIPLHKFEFIDLGDLNALASSYENLDKPDFSTDIIGVLEDYENLQTIPTVNGDRPIVRFRITDGRHSCKVSCWGDLAEQTEEAKKRAVENPIIVIVTSTKLKIYKNSVQISTLPSSKLYLNLDIDAVIAMRQSAENSAATTQKTGAQAVQTMTLIQLADITDEALIEKNVYCHVKVISVEEASWWYDTCGGCVIEVEKKDGKLYCDKCKKNTPLAEKRYRIVILGEDPTEAYNFIISDRGGKRMVGTTATKLISEKIQNQTTNVFPPQIKALTGKDLKLKLEITEKMLSLRVDSSLLLMHGMKIFVPPPLQDQQYQLQQHLDMERTHLCS